MLLLASPIPPTFRTLRGSIFFLLGGGAVEAGKKQIPGTTQRSNQIKKRLKRSSHADTWSHPTKNRQNNSRTCPFDPPPPSFPALASQEINNNVWELEQKTNTASLRHFTAKSFAGDKCESIGDLSWLKPQLPVFFLFVPPAICAPTRPHVSLSPTQIQKPANTKK